MSVLISLSKYFYSMCSHLANGVTTAKEIVWYAAETNYNIVAAVISFVSFVLEMVWVAVEQGLSYWRIFLWCVTHVFHSINEFLDSVFSFVCETVLRMYSGIVNVCDNVIILNSSMLSCLSHAVYVVKTTMLDISESIASVFSWSEKSFINVVVTIYMCLISIVKFCVYFVTGAWHCLGFLLSSIAYFPVYCFECIESLKNQITHNIVHAFTAMPKETYLLMICLCLLYFFLSNIVRYVGSHGIRKLFSSRLSSRRRRSSGVEWQFIDRDFESDFEDLYGNDVNNGNVWIIPGTVRAAETENDVRYDELDSSDGSDSDTVDDDSSDDEDSDDDDDDGGSEDGYTVISDESDSDNSLNSQALSSESSEHEIEVSLPAVDDRYSLRSRSSTPSTGCEKIFSSPEEFEREMEREKDKRKCVVCQDQVKSVLIMPCRHMCMCVLCADHIVRSRSANRRVCPLCRTKIQKVMNIYV